MVFESDNDITSTSRTYKDAAVKEFFKKGCGCTFRCTDHFDQTDILNLCADSNALSFWENHINHQDIVILGQMATFVAMGAETIKSKRIQNDRQLTRAHFYLQGRQVCSKMYLFAMDISRRKFRRLKNIYLDNGMAPNVHESHKLTPKNAASLDQIKDIVSFLKRYAELNAIFLPGRYPNQKNFSVKLLPSCDNRSVIYRKYEENCLAANKNPMGISTFNKTWTTFCGDILTMKPKNDLCEICQRNYTTHAKIASTFQTDAAKLELINAMKDHLDNVAEERKIFDDTIKKTRKFYEVQKDKVEYAHYSFDMAQNVSIPSNPLQPGPLYFLAPFKVAIFRVMNDTAKVQHNFLIPENHDPGKGANAIISMLHYYFENYSFNERHLFLHTDNCRGQNKNNYMMFYLLWRVSSTRHETITLSFLPVGHTKFHCDWAFGLLKQKFKVTATSSMKELCDIVMQSTPKSKINQAVDVLQEKIPFYKWQQYFDDLNFKKIANISKQSSFIFDSSKPNFIGTKEHSKDQEIVYHKIYDSCDNLLRFPEVIEDDSFEMSYERKAYLYKNIRQYCNDNSKDVLCPQPQKKIVKPQKGIVQSEDDGSTTADEDDEANLVKRKRGRPKKIAKRKKNC